MLIVVCVCYACRLTFDKSPLTPTIHLLVILIPPCFLQSTASPNELSNALILFSHRLKTNSKRIFTIRTFKPRLQIVSVRNEYKREHAEQTDAKQKERDKQDCRDVTGVRQTSGPSACGRVELILNKL